MRICLVAQWMRWFAVLGAGVSLGLMGGVSSANAAHAYAQFGNIKYPPDFAHWDYVNPHAPRGGELVLVPSFRISSFDKYNPFTLKGNAPPGLALGDPSPVLETLLTSNFDEPSTTAYGLLAQDVTVAPDRRSVTFRLREQARFHNGEPVLAEDVKATFERFKEAGVMPQITSMLRDVQAVVVVSEREVRFDFKQPGAELPLVVGGLPIISRHWGKGKPLAEVITEVPIGSGPYRVDLQRTGRDISYVRDGAYWGRDLPVMRGLYNFDRITYKVYQDTSVQFEAFKAGEFDVTEVRVAREWARQYRGPKFASGELQRREFAHDNPSNFQGFYFNTRRAQFADPRVRRALAMVLDFEWANRQLFFKAYQRVHSFFPGSDFEAKDRPQGAELAVLKAVQAELTRLHQAQALPDAVINTPVPMAPDTAPPSSLRDNLREARRLLAEAGWTVRDGALRNAQGGAFVVEFLDDSASMGRVISPMQHNLAKLGIASYHRVVDAALYQRRLESFDFDVISVAVPSVDAPGPELWDRFGQQAANTEGANNLAGVRSAAVDALIQRVAEVKNREELVATVQALDRVLRHGHYMIPHWRSVTHRVAWRGGKFSWPTPMPRYYKVEEWVTQTWWSQTGGPGAAPVASAPLP